MDNSPNQSNDNKKKIVKKVVKKVSTSASAGQAPQGTPTKKVVRRVVVKKNVKTDDKNTSQKSLQAGSDIKEVKSNSGKINYREEIEKLAPSTKEENHSILDSSVVKPSETVNENKVIKGATTSSNNKDNENTIKVGKKVLRKKSRLKKMFQKYGIALILFFTVSLSYLGWMHLVPAVLNFKITNADINDFLQPKIGYKVDFTYSNFYTTPKLGVGVRFKNLKLVYPDGRLDDENKLFLKAKSAIFEVPIIPLLMRTIKFNEFSLRSVNANLYKNKDGKYAYLEQFRLHFNPNAKKYLLEIPDIEIMSYNMPSFNAKTGTLQKNRGAKMTIQAKTIKEVLKDFPNSTSIMIR